MELEVERFIFGILVLRPVNQFLYGEQRLSAIHIIFF